MEIWARAENRGTKVNLGKIQENQQDHSGKRSEGVGKYAVHSCAQLDAADNEGWRPCDAGWPNKHFSTSPSYALTPPPSLIQQLSFLRSLLRFTCSKLHHSVEYLHCSLARTRTRHSPAGNFDDFTLQHYVARAISSFSLDARLLGPAGFCRREMDSSRRNRLSLVWRCACYLLIALLTLAATSGRSSP